jgi:hypothetical protein
MTLQALDYCSTGKQNLHPRTENLQFVFGPAKVVEPINKARTASSVLFVNPDLCHCMFSHTSVHAGVAPTTVVSEYGRSSHLLQPNDY